MDAAERVPIHGLTDSHNIRPFQGTGLQVVVFEVGKTEAEHAFKGDLKVFVDMPGKSFTHYTNYTIRIVEKGAKTLDIPDMFFMSSPWNPGKVHGAKWSVTGEGENKAKISWEEPEQRNGPIDGYVLHDQILISPENSSTSLSVRHSVRLKAVSKVRASFQL